MGVKSPTPVHKIVQVQHEPFDDGVVGSAERPNDANSPLCWRWRHGENS